jgi:transglutaminase-like putative cysteine protease
MTFVTPNDSAVRIFARSVAVAAARRPDSSLPPRLRTAAALFAALGEYGIVYVIDPATPFIEFRASKVAVDYIEYPVETLRSRTGDCDDLVSLCAALLESAGVPAMLVTGPGHIFLAFDSGVPAAEMDSVFRFPQDVFEYGGSAWVPVEATLVGESFLESWRSAAEQYRAWAGQGTIARYPVREAWKLYAPTAVPDKGWDPVPPAGQTLATRLDKELGELRSMVK